MGYANKMHAVFYRQPLPRLRHLILYAGLIMAAGLVCGAIDANAIQTRATIELPTQVLVHGSQVCLGEVARLTTSDLDTLKQLITVPLGHAPRAGESVVLEQETLARWLQVRTGLMISEIIWKGAASVEISQTSRLISGDEVVNVAEQALRDWLASRSERAEIHVLNAPRDFPVSTGKIRFEARQLTNAQPAKQMTIWVDVWTDEHTSPHFIRTVVVNFSVKAYTQTPVINRDASAGTLIGPDSVEKRMLDVTTLEATTWDGEISSSTPLRLRRSVHNGDVLTKDSLEAAPAVSHGDWVTLRVNNGIVVLESRVEVLQDGRIGQTVWVKRSKTGESILAQVIGPGRVEVQP